MSQHTILVIDDSATIRKLADGHLSSAGYRVVLAPNAEEGLELAPQVQPDLILLDHQLPGTTGHNVATQLLASDQLRHIPVVISSTLRKKAYAEYTDLDNVVDMLPKPYTEELLKTTVANAIETAAMIVSSQSQGSAVPETINPVDDASMMGSLASFSLRELLDFLNNGRKQGVLEVEGETDHTRIRFHLDKGRIQAVHAHGLQDSTIDRFIERLPESLASLAPVLKMTIGGRSCAEVDGFVQLLDQKVLDPRLMAKLLRYQAAMLVHFAFAQKLAVFRFETESTEAGLHRRLPLDISLLALLVEGTGHCDTAELGEIDACYARRAIRGQNLDRAGLSARHMKLLNVLSQPTATEQIGASLGWDHHELHRVLRAFELADLIESSTLSASGQVVVYEPDPTFASSIRASFEGADGSYAGRVVRDKLALKLVLKRARPDAIAFAGDDEATCDLMRKLFSVTDQDIQSIRRIVMSSSENRDPTDWSHQLDFGVDEVVSRPADAQQLFGALDKLSVGEQTSSTQEPVHVASAESPEIGTTLVAAGNQP